MSKLIEGYKARYSATQDEELSLDEYLDLCRKDPGAYATAAERMLAAIGEPELVDTRNDPRLSRLFANKVIKRYPAFAEFYGMEDAIEQIVSFFQHAAQGLEEKKQILYLLGPVGGGKSSIAERLKQLMEHVPFYAIKGSPVNESPLGLFAPEQTAPILEEEYGIPRRYLNRHHVAVGGEAAGGVRRRHLASSASCASTPRCCKPGRRSPRPSRATRTTRTSPRWSARSTSASSSTYAQDDPDAYSYSGGLCLANQGLLEFVEMFKAPIKVLHPLLTATQEGNFKGTEGFRRIPFDGIILAHSQRVRVAELPQQQEQRGLPRPHLHRQGAVLPARVRGGARSTRSCSRNSSLAERALRARHAGDDGAVLGAVAPEGAGELEHLFARCASTTART